MATRSSSNVPAMAACTISPDACLRGRPLDHSMPYPQKWTTGASLSCTRNLSQAFRNRSNCRWEQGQRPAPPFDHECWRSIDYDTILVDACVRTPNDIDDGGDD